MYSIKSEIFLKKFSLLNYLLKFKLEIKNKNYENFSKFMYILTIIILKKIPTDFLCSTTQIKI
jgi:hypothetical protein